jgi:hypothetical protein
LGRAGQRDVHQGGLARAILANQREFPSAAQAHIVVGDRAGPLARMEHLDGVLVSPAGHQGHIRLPALLLSSLGLFATRLRDAVGGGRDAAPTSPVSCDERQDVGNHLQHDQ